MEKKLFVLFEEYLAQLSSKNCYSAVSSLSQIFHCTKENPKLKKRWLPILLNEIISEECLKRIAIELNKDLKQINTIFSIGNTWDRDEVLMALQQRIIIEIIDEFLREVHKFELHIQTAQVDSLIETVANTPTNKHAFASAIRLMKKNWGLPIKSKWLSVIDLS